MLDYIKQSMLNWTFNQNLILIRLVPITTWCFKIFPLVENIFIFNTQQQGLVDVWPIVELPTITSNEKPKKQTKQKKKQKGIQKEKINKSSLYER